MAYTVRHVPGENRKSHNKHQSGKPTCESGIELRTFRKGRKGKYQQI
jgi:hypothetical protein